jgi:hypothetical protein
MATVEVNLKEGEAPPEQHLEEGEHIERLVVPLSELYNKLQGASDSLIECSDFESRNDLCTIALSKEDGKIVDARQVIVLTSPCAVLIVELQAIPLGAGSALEPTLEHSRLTHSIWKIWPQKATSRIYMWPS